MQVTECQEWWVKQKPNQTKAKAEPEGKGKQGEKNQDKKDEKVVGGELQLEFCLEWEHFFVSQPTGQ